MEEIKIKRSGATNVCSRTFRITAWRSCAKSLVSTTICDCARDDKRRSCRRNRRRSASGGTDVRKRLAEAEELVALLEQESLFRQLGASSDGAEVAAEMAAYYRVRVDWLKALFRVCERQRVTAELYEDGGGYASNRESSESRVWAMLRSVPVIALLVGNLSRSAQRRKPRAAAAPGWSLSRRCGRLFSGL